MADFRKSFEQARSGSKLEIKKKINEAKTNALDNITSNEDTTVGKAKKTVEQTKKTIEIAKKTATIVSNIANSIFNFLIFLITTPVGWVIDAVVIAIIILSIMLTTVGMVNFDTTCPIDPSTGKIYKGKVCENFGDGTKKGRLSYGGDDIGDNNAGGTGEWAKNGIGKVNYRSFNAWRPGELPENLKKYALNPGSVGLGYRNSKGWTQRAYDWGNCTDLSASLMWALWEKNGKNPSNVSGDGYQVVSNWVAKFGGSSTNKPTAGAVFSSPPTPSNRAGHTGVVSHVFENGDILIVEQNYSTLSGVSKGFGTYSWNYRYSTKGEYSAGWSFYDPSRVGYKIVSKARSL